MCYLFLLCALYPPSQPCIDMVDRVEINHTYDTDGRLLFDQVIWWNWSLDDDRYQVVAWRILRDVRVPNEVDAKQWRREHPDGPPYVAEWVGGHATPRKEKCGWVSEWYDEKSRKNRRVIARTCMETWYDGDIELMERSVLPECKRAGLR